MLAAARGDGPLVDLLLAAGADPALTDRRGATASEMAERAGHADLAQRLRPR
jgi:ankyrin repeat protein